MCSARLDSAVKMIIYDVDGWSLFKYATLFRECDHKNQPSKRFEKRFSTERVDKIPHFPLPRLSAKKSSREKFDSCQAVQNWTHSIVFGKQSEASED